MRSKNSEGEKICESFSFFLSLSQPSAASSLVKGSLYEGRRTGERAIGDRPYGADRYVYAVGDDAHIVPPVLRNAKRCKQPRRDTRPRVSVRIDTHP